ncbi:MAG: CHRD domain-containing protein [Candidatus Rokuibacteriota bacterium]
MNVRARFAGRLIAATVGFALLGPGATAGAAVTTLETALTGAAEVPDAGDPDGSGAAQIRIDVKKEKVCFAIVVLDLTLPATAAHIHTGAAGVAGDIVVTLAPPQEVAGTGIGLATGCAKDQSKPLLRDIKNNPDQYYVNVHTSDFPGGAARGQLSVV